MNRDRIRQVEYRNRQVELNMKLDEVSTLVESAAELFSRAELENKRGKVLHNDPHKAKLARTLLRAADLAEAIAVDAKELYWITKGGAP